MSVVVANALRIDHQFGYMYVNCSSMRNDKWHLGLYTFLEYSRALFM